MPLAVIPRSRPGASRKERFLRLTRRGRVVAVTTALTAGALLGLLLAHWTQDLCYYGPCSIPAWQR